MKKLINIILATFAILVMTTSVAKADSYVSGTVTAILKVHSPHSFSPTYEGYFATTGGTVWWGSSGTYCPGKPMPTATDFLLISEAKANGNGVLIYYQMGNSGAKCFTGLLID